MSGRGRRSAARARRHGQDHLGDVALRGAAQPQQKNRRPAGIRHGRHGSSSTSLANIVHSKIWSLFPLHELVFLALVEGDPDLPKGHCRALFGLLPEALSAALIGDLLERGQLELRKPQATFFGGIKKKVLVRPAQASPTDNPFESDSLLYEALATLSRRPLTVSQAVEALARGLPRVVGGPGSKSSGAAQSAVSTSDQANKGSDNAEEPGGKGKAAAGGPPAALDPPFSVDLVLRRGLTRLPQRTGRAMRAWTDAQLQSAGGSRSAIKQQLEECVWRALRTPCANPADQRTAAEYSAAVARSIPDQVRREMRLAAIYFAVDPMLRCAPAGTSPADRKAAKKRGVELCQLVDSGSCAQIVDQVVRSITDREQNGGLKLPPPHPGPGARGGRGPRGRAPPQNLKPHARK